MSLVLCGAVLILPALAMGAAKPVPAAPKIAARAYILQDFSSGEVLAADKADEHMSCLMNCAVAT